MKMNKKGFTIVELVIVIAVIAILAAVLIPTFSNVIDNANKSAAQQESKTAMVAVTAVENQYSESGAMSDYTFYCVGSKYVFKYDKNGLGKTPFAKTTDFTAPASTVKGYKEYTNATEGCGDIPANVTVYRVDNSAALTEPSASAG